MRTGAWLLALLLVNGCTRSAREGALSRDVGADPLNPVTLEAQSPSAGGLGLTDALLALEPRSGETARAAEWSALIRAHRWQDAAHALERLPLERLKDPLVRFARARVAAELADWPAVLEHLRDFDDALPELAAEVQALRLTAEREIGPFASAAKTYSQRADADSQLHAARTYLRLGDKTRARAALDRAAHLAASGSDALVTARCLRARLAEETGDRGASGTDYRWLATSAPAGCGEADRSLSRVAPALALTRRERYERALFFAKAGDVEACTRELELGKQPAPVTRPVGAPISQAEVAHAMGWAVYMSRSDDAHAAKLLEEAATLGGKDAVRDRFYAARAWSRAGADDRAMRQYEALARRFPRSTFGEQAAYQSARLKYVLGRFKEAKAAYQGYLARYGPKGPHGAEAIYELAVSELIAGDAARAAQVFAKLAEKASSDRLVDRYRELQAVGAARAGKKDLALRQFEEVQRERPLSFVALASAAHAQALGGAPAAFAAATDESAGAPPPLELRLPAKARLLAAVGLDTDAEQALREHEVSFRREHGPRAGEALCSVYGELSVATRRYVIGQEVARARDLLQTPPPSRRWLWDCVYPRPYEDIVRDVEAKFELPRHLIHAVMRQESAFKPRVSSPANAIGLMQVIPATAERVARELEVDYSPDLLYDPAYNVRLGGRYLRNLLDLFGHVVPAVAAYNAGPHAVSRWLESGEGLPADLFVARIPYQETRDYVYRVIGNMARYAYVAEGRDAVPALDLELPRGRRAPETAY